MMDVWHRQLALVAKHFPDARLRALRNTQQLTYGTVFAYVTPTVASRLTECPREVVQAFRDRGYTIIHVQEPRE